MNIEQILTTLQLREDKEYEFKSAKGGLPRSLWETFSAMANTEGGYIVLGIKEIQDELFEIQGLDDPLKIEKDFWNTVNNRGKVSLNPLRNGDAQFQTIGERIVFIIQVPIANRRQRPVYVGQNPLTGTYRRYNDGDYLCNDTEVRRMLSDQSEQSADSRILPFFSENDLDSETINQYRNRLSARIPNHPWLLHSGQAFLKRLGGWRHDPQTGEEGVTVAGLLMFGTEETLRSPDTGLKFHLDYRERVSNAIADRWTDRLTPDGTWTPNLFQFFQKVYPKLVDGLKLPFAYQELVPFPDPVRRGTSPVHEAIQEALVNALIHADYHGQGGVVIERFSDRLELSNPGNLLISLEQWARGAVTECRNPTLQLMFQLLGAGDKVGAGVDKIRQGWASQKWRWPRIEIVQQPDRIRLILPMVSLLPEESLAKLRVFPGYDQLDAHEVEILVTANVEGTVSNQRLQQFSTEHATDITKRLQGLVAKGFLVKSSSGRWTTYRLAMEIPSNSIHNDRNSIHSDGNSIHNGRNSIYSDGNSIHNELLLEDPKLLAISAPAREKTRMSPEEMKKIIRKLCQNKYLTLNQIGNLLNRNPVAIRNQFIQKMLRENELIPLHAELNHPQQAYKTNPLYLESDARR
ncbi:MAG: putative DNA binding domain-containing protein [Planctomycetaceae bacterium]|nr:putative DNA binding domain-containing protein [Planctomycetaceae bacterium]